MESKLITKEWLYTHYIEKNMRVVEIAHLCSLSVNKIEKTLRFFNIKKPHSLSKKLTWDRVGRLTLENLILEAKKYKSRGEFQKKSASAYVTARKRGLLDKICSHMRPKRIKWTDDMIKAEALKYSNRAEFQHKSQAYSPAHKRGILDKVCGHMQEVHKNWTEKQIKEESLKFQTRMEFQSKSTAAYEAARRRGILDEVCSHMEIKQVIWTKELVISEALKYNTRSDFQKGNRNAYRAAHSLKLAKEAFSHMSNAGDTSFHERELLKIIKQKYNSATRIWHSSINFKNRKIKRLEVDIYIPELRKGIEFDGTYWHGEGFRRAWTRNPAEYHEFKDSYFKSKGIELLHIKEKDWIENKEDCLKKCMDFLNV